MTSEADKQSKFTPLDEVIDQMCEKHPGLKNKIDEIRQNMKDCPKEYMDIVDDNFWDLFGDSVEES